MNKVKSYQLKNIKQCPFKAYISQFNYKTLNNKSNMIRKVYKDIIQEYDFLKLTETELRAIILEKLDDRYFLTKQEKEVEAITILNYLLRYFEYEKGLNREILEKKVYGSIRIGDRQIEVKADIVFENKDSIELVKYKTSATKLSYKARTEKNKPENDIELFLLKKLGEKIYHKSNKPIVASFYHFKGKSQDKITYEKWLKDKDKLLLMVAYLQSVTCDDKKEQKKINKQIKTIMDVLFFNNSVGNNIITYNYNNDLSNEILELLNKELSYNSEKCSSGDCEFCNYTALCNYKVTKNKLEEIKELKKSSGDVKLTKAQKKVVDIEKGNCRINAVPGSGKSTTMVMRTIELFKKGYKPDDILMITFTNKGCEELKEKISYWLDHYKIKGINKSSLNIYTFNSFGADIITKEWDTLRFVDEPVLATMIDVNDIIKELLEEHSRIDWLNYKNPLLNYPNAKGAFKQLLIYFNLIKSFGYDEETLIKEVISKENNAPELNKQQEKAKLIFELFDEFNHKLKENCLLQYQDQILYLIELLEKYPDTIEKYGFKHVVVDEYQDTDFTQVDLLHLLKQYSQFKSLIVVGDSSQAIYSFRNTTPKNIIDFDKDFDDVQDIFLLENFRSTPQICRVANELDKLNSNRIDKNIVSKKEDGEIPKLLKFKTLEDEYKHIANIINEKILKGMPLHDICYIGRTKKELLELQRYLDEDSIPNILEVSELYLNNSNVQHIINLANFFKNNEYDYYIAEHLAILNDGFGDIGIETSKNIIDDFKTRIIEDFSELQDEKSKIEFFINLVSPVLDDVAKSFISNLQLESFWTFNEFLNHLYKIALYKDDTSIEKDDKKYKAVVLTTAHSSKGKEWSVVINSINNYKYKDLVNEIDLLEEERRLLFVSITRAKDELYLTYNSNENKSRNKGKYSLFADELKEVERMEM